VIRVGVWGLELGYRGETVLRVTVESNVWDLWLWSRLGYSLKLGLGSGLAVSSDDRLLRWQFSRGQMSEGMSVAGE